MGVKKRAKQFIQKHKNSAIKKCWEKNRRKSAKNVFLYSHEYRDQKMGGTKRTKQFFQKQTNSASKNWGKNRRKKVRKTFYIFTQIS